MRNDLLINDMKNLWLRWADEADFHQAEAFNKPLMVDSQKATSRASTKRLCMEDIERLLEKYGIDLPERNHPTSTQ